MHAARGDIRDSFDLLGILDHGATLASPDHDDLQMRQLASSFDVAKRGFALISSLSVLNHADELPTRFRVRECGLHVRKVMRRCAFCFPRMRARACLPASTMERIACSHTCSCMSAGIMTCASAQWNAFRFPGVAHARDAERTEDTQLLGVTPHFAIVDASGAIFAVINVWCKAPFCKDGALFARKAEHASKAANSDVALCNDLFACTHIYMMDSCVTRPQHPLHISIAYTTLVLLADDRSEHSEAQSGWEYQPLSNVPATPDPSLLLQLQLSMSVTGASHGYLVSWSRTNMRIVRTAYVPDVVTAVENSIYVVNELYAEPKEFVPTNVSDFPVNLRVVLTELASQVELLCSNSSLQNINVPGACLLYAIGALLCFAT